MTSDQLRIMYELAVGREIVAGPTGELPKWKDKRPKPSLAKEIISPLIDGGLLVFQGLSQDSGMFVLGDLGKTILEERAGHV